MPKVVIGFGSFVFLCGGSISIFGFITSILTKNIFSLFVASMLLAINIFCVLMFKHAISIQKLDSLKRQRENESSESACLSLNQQIAKLQAPRNWALATKKDQTNRIKKYIASHLTRPLSVDINNLRLPWRRALNLLMSKLDKSEENQLIECGYFFVKGASGRIYCITGNYIGNIIRLLDGQSFCIIPTSDLPSYDQMLAQKLHLEHDDYMFLGYANKLSCISALLDERENNLGMVYS